MDIKIEPKKGIQKKHLPYIIGATVLLALICWSVFGNHQSTLRVDRKAIIAQQVTNDVFNDFIRVDGQVQPLAIIQLSPLEGGIVEEILVEEGVQVKKGQPIVRLSNSNLDLSILNSEAELAEKQNFLRNTQVAMEQDKLNNRTEKLQLDLDVRRKQRSYNQNKALFDEKLIAREEYLQAKEDYDLAKEKQALVSERLKQDSIYRSVQIDQMEESLQNMRENMHLIRRRVANLQIKSPIDGELGLLDVVLGQSIAQGQKIGQVNNLSNFKVEALIDEHYIDRVKNGLEASFDRQNNSYQLKVRKVYPEVRNGKFKTDFIFVGERPDNIRTGQTYYLSLQLGEPTKSILIPKGTFFQATGGSWIFVLDQDEKKAYRRKIKLGRQNPQYYEVIEGLEPGERIIVSNYEAFKDNE
ncbi:MAG: efflux RND transporter periplasmic adaptor subunit, partial [Bacteroidales bacterium]